MTTWNMTWRRKPIVAPLTLLLGSIGIFLAAFAIRTAVVPDVVPIASVEEPQALWALELAFLLKAVEYIAGFGAVVVLAALAMRWIGLRLQAAAGGRAADLPGPATD